MTYVKLALITKPSRMLDALHDTFAEDWRVALQDGQTKRRV